MLEFGVSGNLRNSDLIMYDRPDRKLVAASHPARASWARWRAMALTAIPIWMESWDSFRSAYPDGLVLDEPDAQRPYGRKPYVGYDSATRPFLYSGEDPPHGISPLARVVRTVGDRAWPMERLRLAGQITQAGVNDQLGGGARPRRSTRPRSRQAATWGQIRVRDGARGATSCMT